MIIFLYGSDSYRRKQKLKEIVAEYEKKHQSVGYFDFSIKDDDEEFLRLREFCASHSLFENMKLAVVENIIDAEQMRKKRGIEAEEAQDDIRVKEKKEKIKLIADFLKSNIKNKELTILLSDEKPPLKAFDFLLKKPVLAQEFKNLSAGQLEFFVKKEAEKRGVKLNNDAILFLIHAFSEDTWGLINELEKLSLFNNKNFNAERLKEVIDCDKPMLGNEFFRQISALAFSRSLRDKIINLEILLNREEPAKIFNFLASFSSNSSQIIKIFADYDIAVKSGKMDYEEVLVEFCLN